jgi:hypothetical protein
MSIETFLKDFDVVNFNKDMGNWKKTSWLNIGRDIKSTAGTAERCKTTNCRGNLFNLKSNDNQSMWVGVQTHEIRNYVGCAMPSDHRNYATFTGPTDPWN